MHSYKTRVNCIDLGYIYIPRVVATIRDLIADYMYICILNAGTNDGAENNSNTANGLQPVTSWLVWMKI